MFVSNPQVLKNTYKCSKRVANYITNHFKIPVLSIDKNGDYYFAKSEELDSIIESLPLWLRWFS